MKRFFPPVFLLFLACLPLSAQKITVSEPISLRDEIAYDILGEWSGQFVLLRDQSVTWQAVGFNSQMEQVWEKNLELDYRRPQILEVVNQKRGFSIAYTYRRDLELYLKLHRYDPAANLVDSATVAHVGREFFPISIQVQLSEDRSKLLAFQIVEFREIQAFAFDLDSLTMLWQARLAPDGFEYNRDFQQMLIDNDGNMFCILSKDNRKAGNHFYEVLAHGPATGHNLQRLEIRMGDKLTFDAHFAFDHLNQQLIGGGLYAQENISRAMGTFYMRLPLSNPGGGVLEFEEMSDDLVLTLMGKNFNAKNRGLTETVAREIILRKDGGLLLICERQRIYERNISAGRFDRFGGRFIVDFYLDDLLVTSYNPDGSLYWQQVLHKKQYSQDDYAMYSSYFLMKTPVSLRLIFNDDIKHENTVSEYVISATSHIDRNSVMSTEKQKLRLRFRDAIQISANELIVPSERRSRLNLVRITY